jgi:hypothetical protein
MRDTGHSDAKQEGLPDCHFALTKCSNSTVWQYNRMTVSAVCLTAYL